MDQMGGGQMGSDRRIALWSIGFSIWVACTLSFMAAMSISMALLVLLCAYNWKLGVDWRPVLRSAYLKVTAVYLVVATVSLLVAYFDPPFGRALNGFGEMRKFRYFLQPVIVAWAIISFAEYYNCSIEKLRFWKVLAWMSIAMAIVGIVQFWGSYFLGYDSFKQFPRFFRQIAGSEHSHAQGLMFFHLSFASAMLFSCSYFIARFFWPLDSDSRKERLFVLIGAILCCLAVYFSYSRIAWVALWSLILFLFFLRKPIFSLYALVAGALLVAWLWYNSSDFADRFYDGPGWLDRQYLWKTSFAMLQDRPWFGVGFNKTGHYTDLYAEQLFGSSSTFSSHAHNNFLDVMATTGILGLVSFTLWWLVLLIPLWRQYRRADQQHRWLPAALLGGALAFHINGLTQVNFYDGKSQHSLMLWIGLVLALLWSRSKLGMSRKKAGQ